LLALLFLALKGIKTRQRKTNDFLSQLSDDTIVSSARTESSSKGGGPEDAGKKEKASDAEIV